MRVLGIDRARPIPPPQLGLLEGALKGVSDNRKPAGLRFMVLGTPSGDQDAPVRDAERDQASKTTLYPSRGRRMPSDDFIEMIDGEKHEADG